MRVAISTWKGRISPVFDVARTLLILEIAEGEIVEKCEQSIGDSPAVRIEKIAEAGVQALLCGAISQSLAEMLAARGVKVVPFISGDVDEVVRAYVDGKLDSPRFAMPGYHRLQGRAKGGGQSCGRKEAR
jgi:predicted Fe-Mo cluster-binding NifX family protein